MVAAERVNMLMSSATCLSAVAGNLQLQASNSVQGAVENEQRPKDRRGLLKTPMEVSFSVGLNDSFPGLSR